ncbi:uncharacterized protein LOC111497396 [Cucurbita maxima]|uniref:Uncharacterized protein LOC111497396 n=1 Tax=Cucurbita maxima TaxID=3661 RepID=A0A6J1KP14_CUCMA|nr:uncharacterized protein LOC111497396 [Cucurbita maxima]
MASSQVEFSSSSSPFRCVHRRDRNRRDANVAATHAARFRSNLKSLVMDRLNDCISITPNQNHNPAPSRCAAKQLQRALSTIASQHTSAKAPQTPTPPAPPETDEGTSKLGASSLVQIWEKRLNVSSNVSLNANTNANSKQAVELENTTDTEQACSVGAAGDFEDESFDAGPVSEDGFADWHSSRTTSSSPPSSRQSHSSDAGESEKVRVVDIIRRLTLTAAKPTHPSCVEDNDHSNESSSRSALILRERVERKCLSRILRSPRIRGRQAFADLLLQIQRDRQKELDTLVERRAVSKFPQRGRIQSLLRLKILKRVMALEDEQQHPNLAIMPRENRRSSTIMHLREKFSGVGARSSLAEMLNANDDNKTQSDRDTHAVDTSDNHNDNQQVVANAIDSSIDTVRVNPIHAVGTNDNDNDNQQIVANAITDSSIDTVRDNPTPAVDTNDNDNQQVVANAIDSSIDTVHDNPIHGDDKEKIEEQGREQELDPPTSEATWQDTPDLNLDSPDSISGSEDREETYERTSYDWFTDISRPRSYWEGRRQTWYQQMLDSTSANDEIRQLIKRKTVSNCLSSGFRERMDKLMVSRLERRTRQQEEYDEVNEEDNVAEEELWCFSEGRTQPKSSDNEEEDERSLISGQSPEGGDYLDQSVSPLQLASPSMVSSLSYQDNEMGEDSNRGASSSSPQLFPPQFSSNNQRSSRVSTNHHPSIEMEVICDLRGHMEQLYREMSELRKSIKCCMDMQLMLHQSIKHEAVAGGGRKPSKERSSRKRKCCICYNMQIDSLLYRCGHMCCCMKCAKELQWRGGKCPVCGAPIEDVVRASFTAHS